MLASGPLLERDGELARMQEVLGRSVDGMGGVAVVEGVAGVGKTQLLAAAADAAGERGALVLRARAGELERSFAFGVVRQLFGSLLERAAAADRALHLDGAADLAAPLFDPARLADAHTEAMYPLLHGLFWLAVNLTRERPLVLVVDDVQWADEPSLLFLEFLSRRVAGERIALIAATRPVQLDAPPALAGMIGDASNVAVRPAELSVEATATVLERQLGAPGDPPFVAACHDVTGGNPFLLGELALRLTGEQITPTAANAARVRELGTRAVSDTVRLRVARVGAGASELVDAVAILGDGAAIEAAVALAKIDRTGAGETARRLREAGVLAEGHRLSFAHPVLRAAVYETIAEPDRAQLHVDAAQALLAAGQPVERVVAHLLAVPRPLGTWVWEPLRTAGAHALAVGDLATARRLLERLLVEALPAAERASVLATLGRVQMLSMDVTAAATLGTALAETDDPQVAARAATDLAVQLLFLGRIEELVSVLSETGSRLAERAPELSASLAAGLLAAATISFEAKRRLAGPIAAITDAGQPAATAAERVALVALADRDVLADHPVAEVHERLRRAIITPGLVSDPRDVLLGRLSAAGPLVMSELYEEAEALASEELAAARTGGSIFATAAALTIRAWAAVRRGALVAAETDAREAVELSIAGGFAGFSLDLARACLLTCARETGSELGELRAVLDAPTPVADLAPNGVLIVARAQALADRGDVEAALASLLDAGRGTYADAGPGFVPWRSVAAPMLDRLGRREEAVALADDEVRRARGSGAPGTLGAALAARGRLAGDDAALLEEAVAVLETSAHRLDLAKALVDLGALWRRRGQRAEGRRHLRAGHDLAVECGATVLAARAREELATSGQRLAAPGLTGVHALTPSERRVAEMAAEGMRNKAIAQSLFVTQKTVETHLSRSYEKLGISSRAALGRALAA